MKLVKTAVAAGLLSVSVAAMANLSVGVVNMQNVFVQAPQGQATVQTIKDQLAPQIDKLKTEYNYNWENYHKLDFLYLKNRVLLDK